MNLRHNVTSLRLFICLLTAACALPPIEGNPDELQRPATSAAKSILGKNSGQERDDNGLRMKFIWCPPGEFTRGLPKSEPGRHEVEDESEITLTKGFWLGRFEVTQSEWKHVIATEPWKDKDLRKEQLDDFTKEGDDYPATYISWEDAMEFCRKLTDRERKAGRVPEGWEYTLPTDAQWEYACRAGTKTRFSFGDDESNADEHVWSNETVGDEFYAHRVGKKKPNPWGLCDMHGNVGEWCRDYYCYHGRRPAGRDPEVTKRRGQYTC